MYFSAPNHHQFLLVERSRHQWEPKLRGRKRLGHFVAGTFGIAGSNEEFELEVAEMDQVTIAQKIFAQRWDAALVDISAVATAQVQNIQTPIATNPEHRMAARNRSEGQWEGTGRASTEKPAFTRSSNGDPRSTGEIATEEMKLVIDDRLDIVFRRSAALSGAKDRGQQTDHLLRAMGRFKRQRIGPMRIARHETHCPLQRIIRNGEIEHDHFLRSQRRP
jgi:hypothetical protein